MKQHQRKNKTHVWSWIKSGACGAGWLALLLDLGGVSLAQTPPGVEVRVALTQSAYRLGVDPIKLVVSLENVSGNAVLVRDGLTRQPLALQLTFIDPQGHAYIADQQVRESNDPGPPPVLPVDGEMVAVDPLEILPVSFLQSATVDDAGTLYSVLVPPAAMAGFYRVMATVPLRTYAGIYRTMAGVDYAQLATATFGGVITSELVPFALFTDADGDGYAFPVPDPAGGPPVADCNDNDPGIHPGATEIPGDGKDNDCNPATTDLVVIPPGTIQVEAEQHTVGEGSFPSAGKGPLANLPVHVYAKTAGSCAAQFGYNHQQWKSIWLSCADAVLASGETNGGGELPLTVAAGDYLVLGTYDPNPAVADDELYLGDSVTNLTAGGTKKAKLRLMIKANGKKSSAKGRKITDEDQSELWIIEPEYVEWNEPEELYPFVFECTGDWTVTTTVSPPQGFDADHKSLTTEVNSNRKASQFKIKDIGSNWTDTPVTYDLAHKDAKKKVKKQKIKSQVGVKLSKGWAKAKGLTIWGKPLPPGQGGTPPGKAK